MQIPRLQHPLSLEEFYGGYYLPRKPVIIAANSPLSLGWQTHLWTNEYLLYKAGSQQVQVLTRDDKSNFTPERTRYIQMQFHQFMAKVMADAAGNSDLYLNLQHDKGVEPPLLQLIGDFNIPLYFKDLTLRCINLWMGNSTAPITTPLHHDFNDNLYVVVEGHKRFILFPPEQACNLYTYGKLLGVDANGYIRYASMEDRPHMCQVDPIQPDTERFPLYAVAADTRCECQLEKYEMLFLPTGWFHQVTSIGRHVALSFFSVPPSLEQLEWLRTAIAHRRDQRAPH